MSRRRTALLAIPSTPPQISPIAGHQFVMGVHHVYFAHRDYHGYNGAVKDDMISESDAVWPWPATVVLRVRARNKSGRSKGTALLSGTQVSPGLNDVTLREARHEKRKT
ncbi:uncharacterized protein SPSK_04698 [Sporothrix schenckii 1099-18]|uniref:Uncharacterized protein n=1 Tax=Sporothrix schenckii 1099-18 TaxID=1397361 RepID=A0A0F2M1K7_SPOSC|nr:uncharacterized protein SPSK_04698 [Sporothrix schenckii 1099-18]KJR83592.1 hypothetical protein SPSK_04698 [Sporothrix schenckii 1099-18]